MKPAVSKNILPSFFLYIFLSFLLLWFDSSGFLTPLKSGVENLIVPTKERVYSYRQKEKIENEDQKYKEERERKIATLESQLTALKSENASMRRLLGAPLPPSWRFTPAAVIGQDSYEHLQINKGKDDGIKENMTVVFDNVLLGKVVKVSEHFSQVLLPTADGSKILAVSRNKEVNGEAVSGYKAKGLLIGQGHRVNFERVLLKENLETGDLLVTFGDDVFPPNLLLGRLGKIIKKEGEIYQKAEVEPLVDIEELETVFIITDKR